MSEAFSSEWLALRAPADERARAQRFLSVIRNVYEDRPALRLLDIGAGTGASVALFAPFRGPVQHWTLVDHDPALLAVAEARPRAPHQHVTTRRFDLAGDLAPLFDPAPDLVTAQAFFDLASAAWMRRFVTALAASGAGLYAPLIYNGEQDWQPAHPLDEGVLTAFDVDMQRNKGLGPALGAAAADVLGDMLAEAGYSVWTLPSPWELEAGRDADLMAALASGTAGAVRQTLGPMGEAWGRARASAERAVIGHTDLLALPLGPDDADDEEPPAWDDDDETGFGP